MPSLPPKGAENLAHVIIVATGRYHVMGTSLAADALLPALHVPIHKYSAVTSVYLDVCSG
jgi:hypothetical protein